MTDVEDVATAVGLGWQMANLYQEALGAGTNPAGDPADLPGLSALSWEQLLRLRFHQVSSGLSRLAQRVAAGGLSLGSLCEAVEAATENLETAGSTSPGAEPQRRTRLAAAAGFTPGDQPAAIRQTVLHWHVQILDVLTAADATIGKAYGLGRALADLTLRPTAPTKAAFQADFSGRVETIKSWLSDLTSVLPEHAGVAVRASLDYWTRWLEDTKADDPIWSQPPEWRDPLHPSATISLVTEVLYKQGNLWRAVLTGEKQAVDLLSADEYVNASEALIQRLGMIGRRFWAQYRLGISLAVIALGAVVAGLLLLSSGAAGGLGALGAILAATGITWKGLSSTLGTALRKAEPALWGAQLDLVATVAITILPGAAGVMLDVPKAAGLSRSKQPPRLKLREP